MGTVVHPPIIYGPPPPTWSNATRTINTDPPTYSIPTATLDARITAVQSKFVRGNIITAADVNELISIITVYLTHKHAFEDMYWLDSGDVHPSPTIIDPDETEPAIFPVP